MAIDKLINVTTPIKTQGKVNEVIDQANSTDEAINNHTSNEDNPHNVTAEQIDAIPKTRKVNNKALSTDITLSANDIGLGNVNNTSDANKPISTPCKLSFKLKGGEYKLPTLTGYPKAKITNSNMGTNTTQVATTAFVQSTLSGTVSVTEMSDINHTPSTLQGGDTGEYYHLTEDEKR